MKVFIIITLLALSVSCFWKKESKVDNGGTGKNVDKTVSVDKAEVFPKVWSFSQQLEMTSTHVWLDGKSSGRVNCERGSIKPYAMVKSKNVEFSLDCNSSFENGGLYFSNSNKVMATSFGDAGYSMARDTLIFWGKTGGNLYMVQFWSEQDANIGCDGMTVEQVKMRNPGMSDTEAKKCIAAANPKCKKSTKYSKWDKEAKSFEEVEALKEIPKHGLRTFDHCP